MEKEHNHAITTELIPHRVGDNRFVLMRNGVVIETPLLEYSIISSFDRFNIAPVRDCNNLWGFIKYDPVKNKCTTLISCQYKDYKYCAYDAEKIEDWKVLVMRKEIKLWFAVNIYNITLYYI